MPQVSTKIAGQTGEYSIDNGAMDSRSRRLHSASTDSSTASLGPRGQQALLKKPYDVRDGRRFLRNLPYPLPVDLAELNRQIIHTQLVCEVFGRPLCSPSTRHHPPRRVLEIACGTAHWSALCAAYLHKQGHRGMHFVGVDITPQAPPLSISQAKWTFVQHDLRRLPWPFEDNEFDLVMLKDVSLVFPGSTASQYLMDESIRILRPGGTLEIWTSDHLIRSLLPHPPLPPRAREEDVLAARRSGSYLVAPGTPFAPTQHAALRMANEWVANALDAKGFSAAPCARMESVLYQEFEKLREVGSRRVAVPFGEMQWERGEGTGKLESDEQQLQQQHREPHDSPLSSKRKERAVLTRDQAALRRAALLSHLMMIESLEGLLKDSSGKKDEEWAGWWSSLMGVLLEPSSSSTTEGMLTGECLEVGAWWAVKRGARSSGRAFTGARG